MIYLHRTFLSFALLVLAVAVWAQPVLTTAGQTPTLGETYRVWYTELPGGLDVGPAGANQTWDFSNNNWATFELQFSILDPEDAICANDFPDAEFVWLLDEFEAYNFYTTSATGIDLIGGASGTADEILFKEIHSNTEDGLQFPATFGDSYTYDMEYTSYFFGLSSVESGNGEATFDGYGTIITPAGTFENVLRMKIERTVTATAGIMETQYAWILPGQFIPVMVYTIEDDPETIPSVYYALSNTISGTNDLPQLDLGLRILQNPTPDRLQLTGLDELTAAVDFYLVDALGRVSALQDVEQGVDMSAYTSGYYVLVAQTEKGRQAIPFINN